MKIRMENLVASIQFKLNDIGKIGNDFNLGGASLHQHCTVVGNNEHC
jgi:hypothetical protein